MDAIQLLKMQHKEVKALLEKVVESEGAEGKELLSEISHKLLSHMVIEQELFYPAAAHVDLPDIDEGYEEHFVAREMAERALRAIADTTLFQARCKVLKELVEHHVEEEEDNMLPTVKKKLESDALEMLGEQMQALFEELQMASVTALEARVVRAETLKKAGSRTRGVKQTRGRVRGGARAQRAGMHRMKKKHARR